MASGLAARLKRDRYARRRLALLIGALVVLFLVFYFAWFRDSSLVQVDDVKVEGATTDQEQIQQALAQAADGMSTLNVDEQALARAVSAFPTVSSIAVDAGFPHSLTVTINERLPVAQARISGERTAVSGDGYVLPGIAVEGAKLPTLDEDARAKGGLLNDEGAAQAAILGGAPDELAEKIDGAEWDPERGGVVVTVEGLPELRFGDGSDAEKKWKAVAAVLAQPDVGTPAYVNVEVPDRPATGG